VEKPIFSICFEWKTSVFVIALNYRCVCAILRAFRLLKALPQDLLPGLNDPDRPVFPILINSESRFRLPSDLKNNSFYSAKSEIVRVYD